jgi:hypothetical protein
MPKWEVNWRAYGTAVVEADTPEEAEEEVSSAVSDFDTMMLENIDVDGVDVADAEEVTRA